MPIVSGSELIRLIRKSEILNNVFVLGISASHNGKEASMLAGANAFIENPLISAILWQLCLFNHRGLIFVDYYL